jgi:multicomponent Na+:H+ antiporter subunit D
MSELALLPVLIPLTAAVVAIFLPNRIAGAWAFGAMVTSLVTAVLLLQQIMATGTAVIFISGGWAPPAGIILVGDWLSAFMVIMSQIVLAGGILYALGCHDKCTTYPAFYPAFLLLGTGLTGAMLTGDIFNLFVFAELLVLSGAALTAMSDDKYGTEAAYKYFFISILAAMFLLMACGALYVSYGTLNMGDLAARIAADGTPPLLPTAVGLLVASFMIKGAAFPFHFWQPDFHTAAPTPVHAVLSSVVVKLGIYGFIRLTTLLFIDYAPTIQAILIGAGVIGIFYGGLGAAGTYDAKRMLAYSTMSQLGFILVAIGWGTPLALTAALVFAFNHSLIKAAMLMLAGSVASRAAVKSADFQIITGVGKVMPMAGFLFFVGGLALAGIPPTNGFISKYLFFASGAQASGDSFGQYWPMGLIGVGSSITLVYTIRAFERIWWQDIPAENAPPKAAGDRLIAPALLMVLVMGLGVYAEPLIDIATQTSNWIGDSQNYIKAIQTVLLPADTAAGGS